MIPTSRRINERQDFLIGDRVLVTDKTAGGFVGHMFARCQGQRGTIICIAENWQYTHETVYQVLFDDNGYGEMRDRGIMKANSYYYYKDEIRLI